MKPSHYVAILIRVFALFLFLRGLSQAGSLIKFIQQANSVGQTVDYVFTIVSMLLPIIIATALWIFPVTFAKGIVKSELDQPVAPIDAGALLSVLIAALSIYFLYYATGDAIYWATVINISSNMINGGITAAEQRASIVTTAFELIAAIVLLANTQRIAELLRPKH